jgi:hypothetical protein
VGFRLRAVIEAEDGDDDLRQAGGKMDATLADTVGRAVHGGVFELDAEGLLHGGDGAGQEDGTALRLGCVLLDGETELFGEGVDLFEVGAIGGVFSGVLGAGDAIFAQTPGVEGILAPYDDGHGELAGCGLLGWDVEGRLLAACEQLSRFGGKARWFAAGFLFGGHGFPRFRWK